MTARTKRAARLFVISPKAGTMDANIEARLRAEFSDYEVVDFNPRRDLRKMLLPRGRVAVAGGDGTVEHVVRQLADSQHPVGIIALGTFNNFARALGLPTEVDAAIEVVKHGRPRAITLGRVNGRIFLEACAIGLFGEAIVLGDSAKDMEFGAVLAKLGDVIAARPFDYELAGDINGSGSAMSLVFSNTSSIGSNMRIADATPIHPYLELSIDAGRTRSDIVGRAIKSALQLQGNDRAATPVFRFKKVSVRTRPRVRVYADNHLAGRTPATVTAETSALKVLLPPGNPK